MGRSIRAPTSVTSSSACPGTSSSSRADGKVTKNGDFSVPDETVHAAQALFAEMPSPPAGRPSIARAGDSVASASMDTWSPWWASRPARPRSRQSFANRAAAGDRRRGPVCGRCRRHGALRLWSCTATAARAAVGRGCARRRREPRAGAGDRWRRSVALAKSFNRMAEDLEARVERFEGIGSRATPAARRCLTRADDAAHGDARLSRDAADSRCRRR